jgi:hypothetical protein
VENSLIGQTKQPIDGCKLLIKFCGFPTNQKTVGFYDTNSKQYVNKQTWYKFDTDYNWFMHAYHKYRCTTVSKIHKQEFYIRLQLIKDLLTNDTELKFAFAELVKAVEWLYAEKIMQ